MNVISGQNSSASLKSRILSQSLANRLRLMTDSLGSTLFRLTWKDRVTPSGRLIPQLAASGLPTGDKGSTGVPWTTPQAHDVTARGKGQKVKHGTKHGCADLNQDAALAFWPTPMAGSPATEEYNEAGNTDYSRKVVDLASWPTPNTPSGGPNSKSTETHTGGMDLEGAASMVTMPHADAGTETHSIEFTECSSEKSAPTMATWATPASRDFRSESATDEFNEKRWAHGRGKPLSAEVAAWVTSTAQDHSRGTAPPRETDTGIPLTQQVSGLTANGSTAETAKCGQLNPNFSRWLMGLPTVWESCADMVTRSSRRKPKHL
jgi:hypothetical protein